MRDKNTKSVGRIHILNHAMDKEQRQKDQQIRWLTEAIIELCITIDDAAEQISGAIKESRDLIVKRVEDVNVSIQNVEKAVDDAG